MNAIALTDALDSAIQKVCSAELDRLVGQDNLQSHSSEIGEALNSLKGLQKGIEPNYQDPLVALLYLSWYQPKQIRWSRMLIKKLTEVRNTNTILPNHYDKLWVVDFGAGALAMQFAVALAVAHDLANGGKIASVNMEYYDPNLAMCDLGEKLWGQFKIEVRQKPQLSHLKTALDLVKTSRITAAGFSSRRDADEERWLTAIHTLYRNNVSVVKKQLSSFVEMVDPHIGLLSGHDHFGMGGLLNQASPFDLQRYTMYRRPVNRKGANVRFPKVTQWRRSINCRLPQWQGYLDREVGWDIPNCLGQIYRRK